MPSGGASLPLRVIEGSFVVCRFEPGAALPEAPPSAGLWSATRTAEELSLVCEEALAPPADAVEGPFRAIMVQGPLDFSLVGILSSLSATLAEARVSIFALSTYDTDYILVGVADFELAVQALQKAGHDLPAP